MRMIPVTLLMAVSVCTPLTQTTAADAARIRVEDAWVRGADAGQVDTWAYARLVNDGGTDALVAATSPDADRIILRATNVTDAGRRVRTVLAIPVPGHGTLALAPDTYFLSVSSPHHALVSGQSIQVTFRFRSGVEVTAPMEVRQATGDPADGG